MWGFLGYAIGYYLFDAIGRPVLEFYGAIGHYEALKWRSTTTALIIILKGMTLISISWSLLPAASYFDLATRHRVADSRSLRFYLLAALLWPRR